MSSSDNDKNSGFKPTGEPVDKFDASKIIIPPTHGLKRTAIILPTNDLLFRKIFTSPGSGDIAAGFVSDFFGLEVTYIESLTTYDIGYYRKLLGEGKMFKTEVDFRCIAQEAYQILTDMQVLMSKVYAKRALYYFCTRYADLYTEGLESEQRVPKKRAGARRSLNDGKIRRVDTYLFHEYSWLSDVRGRRTAPDF
ncbi:MAG: Rpn family recombination-promoting nuclease/putative transposase [Clostridiales bacterium]|jgi:hypothetical protein|nr:Rpn family recombination-promoting nuclease/putative transposase [Clostridiales bacterium]